MILIIIFAITLCYLAAAGRLDTYVKVLAIQGFLLFGVAFMELHEIAVSNLVFILAETLLFKGIIVPIMITKLIASNKLRHEIKPDVSNFSSLFVVSGFVIASFVTAYKMHDEHLKIIYFAASISALFTGLYLIISRRKIITHIMGYMVIENGIFLLSLALGSEMPMVVNIAILLDLFTSVLLLTVFVNRISNVFKTIEIDHLSELQD